MLFSENEMLSMAKSVSPAISAGIAAADAERLRTVLAAQRSQATGDAGPGDGGAYTRSTCP